MFSEILGFVFIITSKNGVTNTPAPNTKSPIIVYAFLYNNIKDDIFFLSFCASGLYRLKTIAFPIPNSANDNIVRILVKSPFTPKYSAPKILIKTVLVKKFRKRLST